MYTGTHYIVIIEHHDLPSGRLYGAFVPDVPGCTVTGTSIEHTLAQMQTTLAAALLSFAQAGKKLPVPHSFEEHEQQFRSEGEALQNVTVATVPFTFFPP